MYAFVNEEMGFRTIKSLMSLSAFGSILKDFFGNRCQLVQRSYSWLEVTRLYTTLQSLEALGVYRYVHDGQVNEEMDSHITENWRAFQGLVLF
jgi:hypothetical protein